MLGGPHLTSEKCLLVASGGLSEVQGGLRKALPVFLLSSHHRLVICVETKPYRNCYCQNKISTIYVSKTCFLVIENLLMSL